MFITSTCLAYRMIVIYLLFGSENDPSWVLNERKKMDESIAYLSSARDRIGQLRNPERVYSVKCFDPVVGTLHEHYCVVLKNGGATPEAPYDYDDAEAKYVEWKISDPLRKDWWAFTDQVDANIYSATTLYDAMSKKVGSSYPISGAPIGTIKHDDTPPPEGTPRRPPFGPGKGKVAVP